MTRREAMALIAIATLARPLAARAQPRERVFRVAMLLSIAENDPEGERRVHALRQALRELGWIEGRNVQVEYRFGAAEPDRIAAHVADLVALQPDVIVGNSTRLSRVLCGRRPAQFRWYLSRSLIPSVLV
jgi:putative tryptophan/tyrosine transport system substrate-binding protein